MNSGTVLAGNDGLTSMTSGVRAMLATGVVSRMKLKIVVERRIDGIRRRGHKKCVAIWTRLHDRFSGQICAGARLIFDDKLLPKPLRQPWTQQTCQDVGNAAGRKADNQTHRPRQV